MSINSDLLSDLELAKTYIANSNETDQYKRSMLRILNISVLSTNGLSPEEKIQKMSEALFSLIVTQVMFISKIDDRIDSRIEKTNTEKYDDQCKTYDTLARLSNLEQHNKDQLVKDEQCPEDNKPLSPPSAAPLGIIRELIANPFCWLFMTVAVFSPYMSELLKQILSFFSK